MNEQSLQFLQRKLIEQYGQTLCNRIFEGFSARRKTTFRVNPLKSSLQEVCRSLDEAGIPYDRTPWYADALETAQDVSALALFAEGKIYLQSLSSMLPPLLLLPDMGKTVLDMAAAPGGKTCQTYALSGGTAVITACERHPARAERLKFNLAKQGVKRVNVLVRDARDLDDFFAFDSVLLDTPCSGSGTVQLKESDRSVFSAENLQKLQHTQHALLKKGLKLLKAGRTLVYSTCSLFREENEYAVQSVVDEGLAEIVPLERTGFEDVPFLPSLTEGVWTVCPTDRYEGFFVAKLRKKF